MILEVLSFPYDSVFDLQAFVDVLLRAALNTVVSQLQGIDSSVKQVKRTSSFVHQVDLGQHTDRALTVGVHLFGDFERVRVG